MRSTNYQALLLPSICPGSTAHNNLTKRFLEKIQFPFFSAGTTQCTTGCALLHNNNNNTWLTDLEGGSSSSSSSSSSFFSSHCAASSVHRFDPLKEDEIFNAGWIWMRRRRDRGRGKEAGRREDRSKTVDSKMALCSLNLIRRRWIISLLKSPFQRNPRNNGQEVEVLCTTDRSKRNWLRNNCRVTTRISWPPLGSHHSSVVGRSGRQVGIYSITCTLHCSHLIIRQQQNR